MSNPAQVGWIHSLYFTETIVHLVLLMAIRKTTNGLKKGPSRRPMILQRGKTVFIGRVEPRGTPISVGFMNVTNIKNGPLYDFNEFDFFLTLPLVGGVFLWSAPGERSGDGAFGRDGFHPVPYFRSEVELAPPQKKRNREARVLPSLSQRERAGVRENAENYNNVHYNNKSTNE